jgi:hypothetical protein
VNWTVPDSSPWIHYESAWFDSDSFTEDYNNGTFHFTNVAGASAVLNFNGTGVTIWGAYRPNHVCSHARAGHSICSKSAHGVL